MKINIINFAPQSRIPKGRLKRLALRLFKKFKNEKRLKRSLSPRNSDVSDLEIIFLPQGRAKALNQKYRKKNYPTDILSFSREGHGQGLGELVLCPKVLKRQAAEHRVSYRKELDYMIIHGFLHLLGYDHEKSREEELKMMSLQDKLFEKLSED